MQMLNKIQMASEDVKSFLKTGVFYDADDKEAATHDGAVVSIKDPVPHSLYGKADGSGMKDLNANKIVAGAKKGELYGIVDYVGVSQADVMGVTYRIGDSQICY